uniref:Ig-like domain-containing protein n=1 Tax=Schizaphis graminum TaxID=13262 RepID=A0A2S2P1Z9_SCHGA
MEPGWTIFLQKSIRLPAAVMAVSPGLAAKLSKLPDFLLSETCYAYCQISSKRRLPKYRNTFVLEEGSSLTLVCAEAIADKKVTWRKDGLLLTETESTADDTSGALVDTFGTLYLVRLTSDDSGNYTCFVDGNRTQEVLLAVQKSSLLSSKAYARHLYYLYYIFAIYFVVFGARIYYAFLNRRDFLKITDNDVLKPEIPIVYLGRKIRIR